MNSEDIKTVFSETVLSDWETPIELDNKVLPVFDTSIFPGWLRDFIEAVAIETQTPIDAAAMNSLAILSTAIGGKFNIRANKSSWIESLNTYSVIALESSERKTAVYKLFLKPILSYEIEENSRLSKIILEEKAERNTKVKRIDYLQQQYSKQEDEEKSKTILIKIKNMSREIDDSAKVIPKELRLFTNDVTPETIAQLMFDNNECLSILSDEGAEVFQMMAGRYSNKINIDIYLKSYSGGNVTIDRTGGKSISLKNPILTIGLYVQPTVIQEIPNNFSSRGLTQRFLYSIPKSLVGERDTNPPQIPISTNENYKSRIRKLLDIKVNSPLTLEFDEEAQKYVFQMLKEIERMLGNQDINQDFKSWLGKLCGQIIRISGLIHIASNVSSINNNFSKKISIETLQKADSLRNYFIQHAEIAYGIINDNENLNDVKYILSKLTTSEKFKEQDRINYQDLWQLVKKRFSTANELKRVLYILEEMNYIKIEKNCRKSIILLNPKL
ncbi:YfjI family protein [Lysinibacillus sp. SGAir0095]|uniref:YfjI family protein n=1 Tax=Lysinibacillus sp. SGAir0095 TaxID=2070463 RepID=UPI0010CD549B|nr:YfjI family protein [Lysinibacillus sp. SGAir0095]QCR33585.1 hypothetical protein C1N55_16115 [Lysinibacillus sp. SGAir0095]